MTKKGIKREKHQKLPTAGIQREELRRKGQFWTPSWVAKAMVAYVRPKDAGHLFDPAVGAGAFFKACKAIVPSSRVSFLGTDIDPGAVASARENGLTRQELRKIEIRNFILTDSPRKYEAIVANPPYIRHHRLSSDTKQELRLISRRLIGKSLDGRAGLHIYFLLRSLELLSPKGRLAFILPGDSFEGVFAADVWTWIAKGFRIEAVVTFDPSATPFPGVDTNAVVVFLKNDKPATTLLWGKCNEADSNSLFDWVRRGMKESDFPGALHKRTTAEGIDTGLSRVPGNGHTGLRLKDLATVKRGIVTGDNEFFFMTAARAEELGIPAKYLIRAVGRTRDAAAEELTNSDLDELESKGRPTYVLNVESEDLEELPEEVARYLKRGERTGVNARPLVSMRYPWHRMERRVVPPILFAYLGRRHSRFILNRTNAVPLTAFLCVYPREPYANSVERLWRIFNHPKTLEGLASVGKSYGSGAIKVEPRSLDRLPIPEEALEAAGLETAQLQEPPQYAMSFAAG